MALDKQKYETENEMSFFSVSDIGVALIIPGVLELM